MEEESNGQIKCLDCDGHRLQLIFLEIEKELHEYILHLICLSCGLYSILPLETKTIVTIGDLTTRPKKKQIRKTDKKRNPGKKLRVKK